MVSSHRHTVHRHRLIIQIFHSNLKNYTEIIFEQLTIFSVINFFLNIFEYLSVLELRIVQI